MTQIAALAAEPRLLDRLGEIDADWLTAVLRRAGHDDAEVKDFAISPIGNGNVSDTVRIDLTHRADGATPRSLVAKFRCSDATAHGHGISSGSYFREAGSFPMAAEACRTPRLYWVAGGHENINLVMEDLSGTARAGDQIAGCSPADARAAVTELAKLHRAFFPMARGDRPEWAMTMADTADYWVAAIERALPIIGAEVADVLSPEELAGVDAAGAVARRWYERPVARGTLTHGDPRVDNILFLDREDGGVEAVLIDWQMTGWRNPMHDVGYFLSGSVSESDRREHERELLAHYGSFFGDDYSLAEITADYRVQLLSGLMTTVAAYGLLPMSPPLHALLLALLRRNLAAALDWDSFAAVG